MASAEGLGSRGAGGLVFDVGANFGQSAARYLAAGHRVVAVEPNPAAAEAMRRRLQPDVASGRLVVEERAVWPPAAGGAAEGRQGAVLYVNEEDSEWSSLYEACGRRYGTEAREVEVETTTLEALYRMYGPPSYVKIDTEGADGICLEQMKGLKPPPYLSFELNSIQWLRDAAELGYDAFKVVAQACHEAEELLDRHGRPLTHAGAFGEDAVGVAESGGWRSLEEALADVRRLCLVHDAAAGMEEFATGRPHFVERDFATLQACFPVESRNDEEWYDVHCRHASVRPAGLAVATLPEPTKGSCTACSGGERSRSPRGRSARGTGDHRGRREREEGERDI